MMKLRKPLVLLFCLLLPVTLVSSEQQESVRRKISLKVLGGGGFALIGSVNRSLALLNDNETFKELRESDLDSISGELKGLNHWLAGWEIELRMDLSQKWSIGIAASAPYHSRKESSLSYAILEEGKRGPRFKTLLYRPEARVSLPAKLNIYYSRRYWKKPKITLTAGIGYYPARLSQYSSAWIDDSWMGSSYWEVESKFPIGFHGGVSLEYPLSKSLYLVIDVQARYVLLDNLQGHVEGEGNDGTYYESSGRLYSIELSDKSIPAFYDVLTIFETPPGFGRYATFNLSGVVLCLGIRVPLF